MCGICGVASLDGSPVDAEALGSMREALYHRGPDSGGAFVDPDVALGIRRLAIIDLAGGDQPIQNEDGTVHVVQNGEIYNYRELRAELARRGHRFATQSDTEVLVHLYEERGPRFVEDLRGMFAIALWDAGSRRLILARDRFGIKPLYYSLNSSRLLFGSELKALLRHDDFSRDIDLDAVDAFLAFNFVPAPLTIFRDARKLAPGSILVWEEARSPRVRIERYARPSPVPEAELGRGDEADLAEELRERLRDSVRAHLVADVPVGVLLSGGIDSALLTAFAAKEASGRVSTFTIGFDEPGFDERAAARVVARQYDTDHHELVIRPDAAELLPALVDAFDEPFADASAIPTYLVSGLAREHVKVALSGEGGDELFGGYDYYVGHRLAPWFGRAAAAVSPLVERIPASTSSASTLDWKAKRFARAAQLSSIDRHYEWKSVMSHDTRTALMHPERRGNGDPRELLRNRHDETDGAEELARVMDVDLGIFLVDDMLAKTDRASMAHSLEARVPILDSFVAEFALRIPSNQKVRRFSKKRLLRRALDPLLPREILDGKKRGFSIPLAAWLRSDLEPFAREILSESNVERQGFFRPGQVRSLLDDHLQGREDNSRKLWALLVFGSWFDRYGNGARP